MSRTIKALAVLLMLAFTPAAQADTIHVHPGGADTAGCGAVATPCATLGHALNARVTPAPDTIVIDHHELFTPGLTVSNANAAGDTIAGNGTTKLRHANGGADPILALNVPLTIRDLELDLPPGTAASRRALTVNAAAAGTRIEHVGVDVRNASTASAMVTVDGANGTVIDHLRVSGNHTGDALDLICVIDVTVSDSELHGGTAAASNALSAYLVSARVQRTRLSRDFAAAGLDPVVQAIDSQLTLESSLVTGGRIGINSQANPGQTSDLTLRGVTVDVANPGVADAPPDRHPIYVRTTMPGSATATATVERSIFVEPIYTFVEAGSTVHVDCIDSVVPLQQSATVACGDGNAESNPASVFANAVGGDYTPKPGSVAIDGAAGALAAGESTTDLAGAPRLLDGNGDCIARADRGAFELTGHETACPAPAPSPTASTASTPPASRTCVVPKLKRGVKLATAKAKLAKAGCLRAKTSKVRSQKTRKGRFVRFTRKAGTRTAKPVGIVLSRGRR